MNLGKPVFSQLMSLISDYEFSKSVYRYYTLAKANERRNLWISYCKRLVEEYLQNIDVKTLTNAIDRLQTTSNLDTANRGYDELWNMLISKGQDVSKNVAENILKSLN